MAGHRQAEATPSFGRLWPGHDGILLTFLPKLPCETHHAAMAIDGFREELYPSYEVVVSGHQDLRRNRGSAVPAALDAQQLDDFAVRPRLAEQKTLGLGAAFGAQAAQFGLGLDAFGGDGDAEPLAER